MTTTRDPDQLIVTFLAEGRAELPDRTYDAVRAEIDRTRQRRVVGPLREPRADFLAKFAIGASAVAVLVAMAVVGFNLLPAAGQVGGPPVSDAPSASSTASPSPSPSGAAHLVGIPDEGTEPSEPGSGELVLRWDGSLTVTGTTWVYADGRLLRWRLGHVSDDNSGAYVGLEEQRLTPAGVAFLRSRVISTGLFDADLMLAREGNAPFLEIQVRNGDRLVGVTWAWRGISGDAPVATPEQESALFALDELLWDPAPWPASAWEDQAISTFVPSEYGICLRVFTKSEISPTEPIEPARIWSLLPGPAESLLLAGEPAKAWPGDPSRDCSRMTTDDARAVARILEDAGIRRAKPERGGYWLRFSLGDQGDFANEIWISFAPVLPHGEVTWLGPG